MRKIIIDQVFSGNLINKLKPLNQLKKDENSDQNQIHIRSNSCSTIESTDFSSENKTYILNKHLLSRRLLVRNKKESYREDDNLMIFENFEGINKTLEESKLTIEKILVIQNCIESTFIIPKKINRIYIINSEDIKLTCEDLLVDIELINVTKLKIQCKGLVNMINVDSCKDVLLYLYPPSAHIPISVSNSSDIRLRVNKDGNDTREFNDYFIPESFVFKINDDMKLESKVHFRYGE
jgi:hypothetical protein